MLRHLSNSLLNLLTSFLSRDFSSSRKYSRSAFRDLFYAAVGGAEGSFATMSADFEAGI
jgi:hypothetical protein